MEPNLRLKEEQAGLPNAIVSTLAFFSLYDLPLSNRRLHELLLEYSASPAQIESVLATLVTDNKIFRAGNLYSLKSWKADDYRGKQVEISKKWNKIDRYFNWLSVLPYIRQASVINSLAMGTADADSDIDFFVITEKNRLYFVRSMIIVLFRLLGIYKTRQKIKDKFCFGFFVTKDSLNLKPLLLKPSDPYFMFWLVNMRPIIGGQEYWRMMQENSWLLNHFPNFQASMRLTSVRRANIFIRTIKFLLEIVLWIPASIAEPILRRVHINHTFKLAENNTVTSTTVANAKMLKLHAYDVRPQIAQAYERALHQSLDSGTGP